MAPINQIDKNLFAKPFVGATVNPAITPVAPKTFEPASKVSFGHLTGLSKNGPGSLLQAAPGEIGLGDRAILTSKGEMGRKLFLNA